MFYRHPKNHQTTSDNIFTDKLDQTLKRISKENKINIICGDFNYTLLNYEHNIYISEIIDDMYSHLFQPCIIEPTRIVKKDRLSLFDNIFINTCTKKVNSGNVVDKISDHMPNFLLILEINNSKIKQKTKVRDMKNFAKEDFQATLENKEITGISDTQDIDSMYNIFQTKLLNAIDKHAPFKNLSQKEVKMRKKPWIIKQILTKIREKNKTYEKYLKSKDIFWYNRYINSRNTVKRLIEKSKKSYGRNYF